MVNPKASYSTLKELFEILEKQNHLRKLKISHIELRSDILLFSQLNRICQNSTANIVDLDFSCLNLLPSQLADLMCTIEQNCFQLSSLDLSFNSLSQDPKSSSKFCDSLVKLLTESQQILHLNLENMCLGKLVLQLMWPLSQSRSL